MMFSLLECFHFQQQTLAWDCNKSSFRNGYRTLVMLDWEQDIWRKHVNSGLTSNSITRTWRCISYSDFKWNVNIHMVLVININFLNIEPFQACLTSCLNILQISLNNTFPILVITKWQICTLSQISYISKNSAICLGPGTTRSKR